MRKMLIGALLAAVLAGCASVPTPAPQPAAGPVGRIYSYVRSNRDGSEAERIHVYLARPDYIEVAKMRDRCTNAAFVTAEIDQERGQARRMTGGRLLPGAEHRDFAELDFDPETNRLSVRVDTPDGPLELAAAVPDKPWHLYDFDLASLTVTNRNRPDWRADFSFGLPLIWLDGDPADALRYLGRADVRFVREENYRGRRALRFDVGGPAFGDRGGPLWFDAAEGHVLGAEWGLPNHAEYRDFALRLTGTSDGGAEEWRRLLTAHFEGCPA